MESSGVRGDQVVQVRGYADHNLRKPLQPDDASNRRITVIIQYMVNPGQQPEIVSNGALPAATKIGDGSSPAVKQSTGTTTKP
jgi:hypothetical protein